MANRTQAYHLGNTYGRKVSRVKLLGFGAVEVRLLRKPDCYYNLYASMSS